MHVKVNHSKQKVIDAASLLFFQKGFHGTSVRDIAEEASVNVSLISYYFKGKQGLFEHAVTRYYEEYFEEIEKNLQGNKDRPPLEQFKELIATIFKFKQQHFHLTCTIHRELSLDSVFVREMTVTYLAKENHYLEQLLKKILDKKRFARSSFLILQLKGMLLAPYILHHEWQQPVVSEQSHQYFISHYIKKIHDWLDFLTVSHNEKSNI